MGLNEAARGRAYESTRAYDSTRAYEPTRAYGDTVRIDIGELVLDGFERVDPERVSAAFRAELTRLVRERGVPLAVDGTDRALDALAGLPALPATTSPGRLGEALARAVHAGLSGRGEVS